MTPSAWYGAGTTSSLWIRRFAVVGGQRGRMLLMIATWYLGTVVVWSALQAETHWPNNFLIFQTAAENVLAGRDLYVAYPARHFDLFKYSPTFALLFVPFRVAPVGAGLLMWNLLGAGAFMYAVVLLMRDVQAAALVLALTWWAFFAALRGAQSNALVTGLMIGAFLAIEHQRPARAALAIALGAAIKLFPLIAVCAAALHRARRRFAFCVVGFGLVVAAVPLVVLSPQALASEYVSWLRIEGVDSLDRGSSVMGMIHQWFGLAWPNWPIQLVGALVLLAPIILRRENWRDVRFRQLLLVSMLIYVVIFNHQAEYQSYVIAATGTALWYVWSARRSTHLAWAIVTAAGLHPLPYLVSWIVVEAELLGLVPRLGRARAHARHIEVREPDRFFATSCDER